MHPRRTMMRSWVFRAAPVGLAVVLTGCATTYPLGPPKRGWPSWAEELISNLECGMAVADAQRLAGTELSRLGGNAVLGTHMVQRRFEPGSVVLVFEEGRLESCFITRPVPATTSLRTSPRRNLCTGESSFVLKMGPLFFSDGTKTYLDGRVLRRADGFHGALVAAGRHELRIEMPNRTVVHHLDLRPEKDNGILYFVSFRQA